MAAGIFLIAIALILAGIAVFLVSANKQPPSPQLDERNPQRRGRMRAIATGLVIVGLLTALVETVILKLS